MLHKVSKHKIHAKIDELFLYSMLLLYPIVHSVLG
jgi:hypothetical protein